MFTQSCYIKDTSAQLKAELVGLGYMEVKSISKYPGNKNYIYCSCGKFSEESLHFCKSDKYAIYCQNKDLFIAISSIRDDSDINQWFASNYFDKYMQPDSFIKCTINDYKVFFSDCAYIRNYDDYHKASVNELINYFNKTFTHESTNQKFSIRNK